MERQRSPHNPLQSCGAPEPAGASAALSQPERVLRWHRGAAPEPVGDEVAAEEPLAIHVRGQAMAVTMRTPGHDKELAAGLLLAEGVVRDRRDIRRIAPCERAWDGNVLNVFLADDVPFDPARFVRHVVGSSSCGLCGRTMIDAMGEQFPPVRSAVRVRAEWLLGAPAELAAVQAAFHRTGGMHAAGLFAAGGKLLAMREDIGRHNAVDKVLGRALLDGQVPLEEHVLLVSGRVSFEIMQKALAARVAVVAAVSAPSSLAVEFARQSGQTLVAFLRPGRFNVYAGAERVAFEGD